MRGRRTKLERGEQAKLKVLKLSIINEARCGTYVTCAQISSFIMSFGCSSAHLSSPNWECGGGPSQPGWLPYGAGWSTDGDAGGSGTCAAQGHVATGAFTPPPPSPLCSPQRTTASKPEPLPPAACTLPILSDEQL